MPDRYQREINRIVRSSQLPIAQPLTEIVLDLDQLRAEAEAGGHTALATAISAAAQRGRKDLSSTTRLTTARVAPSKA